MVEAQTKNQSIFWLWSDEIDFQKRGDAIYWSPELVALEKHKNSIPLKQVAEIKGGKRLPLGEDFSNDGDVPYIRTTDFTSGYIDYSELKKISEKVFNAIRSYQIYKDEVLISIVGTIGAIAILDKHFERCNFTENAAKIVCSDKLNPYYLYAFLSSQVGQRQLKRLTVGGVQPKLPLYAVEEIKILLPDKQTQQEVEQVVKEAFKLKKEVEEEYQEAIAFLEATLKFSGNDQRVFTRWSNEIDFVKRLDVGYWQQPTIEVNGKKLSEVASVNTGKQYTVYENAKSEVEFISIKDFENLYVGEADRFILQDDVIEKTKITRGDVLLAVTGATIGKVGIFNRPQAVVSADVAIIRTKTLKPNFLGALIQSKYGKSLIDKYTYGATNKHLDIKGFSENFIVPQIDKKIAYKVSDLLDSSSKHREESKQKLQEAKEFVESLIL